ncbi:MAG: efflux RND transporter periplasmic adaptor subunit [Acidobacteria bacterium]|nr:efflux RND transporter periplasmic adaptor subunit [Acidobacteriota bacterium]
MSFHLIRQPRLAAALTTLLLAGATACSRGNAPASAAAPPPPMGVSTITLEKKPIEQASGFIATIRSLRSSTVKPEVDGVVTRIFVKSGDRVALGAPIAQIKPDKQQATVRSTEASRAGVEADVQYWRQQVKRLEALVAAGAISRQEFEQAENSLRTSEARLSALNAQVNEQQVELQYYRVAAPQAGVVGDIAIREGDRVTNATMITTIDDNSGLEAYIQIPIDRSPDLRLGLPVQILDADGKVLATNPITFVAPRVDDATQTVLVKSLLREVPPSVRTQQFVRSRIIWRTADGLTIPLTAVTRINGKYFCYVVETSKGATVARQRPIEVGDLLGNDYVVLSGLSPGEKVIVSGIQKIGDGAPVKPQ